MAESTLNLTYTNLLTEAAYLAGYNPSSPGSPASTRLDEAIQAGYRKFLQAHHWSFLTPRATLSLQAPYSTGTITVVDGAVTGSGTTFPSWAASGELIVAGEHYTVSVRGGNTSLTLDDTTLDVDADSSYTLVQTEYDLPDDYWEMEGSRLTFEPLGSAAYCGTCDRIAELNIREMRSNHPETTDQPKWFAVYPDTHVFDGTESVRYKIQFWPAPDQAYTATYRYTRLAPLISASNDYFLGGMIHAETIRESVLSEVERVFHDGEGVHQAQFISLLQKSIENDNRASSPTSGGYNGDDSDHWEHGWNDRWHRHDPLCATSRTYTYP